MAPPTRSAPHPGRAIVALAVLIVAMLLGIIGPKLADPSQWSHRFTVGLGLDLSSGTQVTLQAKTLSGGPPPTDELNAAVSVILARVNGTGNSGAQVQPQGSNLLVVTVPGKGSAQTIQLVSQTALLMFRQVLLWQADGTSSSTSTPSASTSPSASPSPSASSSSSPKASSSPSASASATSTANTSAKIVPATASASASPTATASSSPKASSSATASSSPKASASASPSPSPSASASTSSSASGDASLVNKKTLALFNKLNCKAGDTENWKSQVGYNTSLAYNNPDQQVVACGENGGQWGKYALDVAKVKGQDVTSATAVLSTTSNQWQVDLTLNSAGASAFSTLTSNLYNKYYTGYTEGDEDDTILNQVAIALDGNVVSAPQIVSAIPGGNAQITGSFTQAQATQLQNQLKFGSVPLDLKLLDSQTVSAQVGRNQLDAGLIAAGIGLFLVVVYAFIYYRGLGIVSISSLTIAALIAYLGVVLLSQYQNFKLELSGIAGLIVAIGITADSFVVFFERLRDEVREGKQLRSAVEAGWKRARRTILVSDTVSFLAAVLLYYFSIGEVKGFAFTLGLTTLIDVVVVFLFTKPMVTILAGTKFYGNGHPLSGLDPARLGARGGWRTSVRHGQPRRRPGDPNRPPNTVPRNTDGA